MANRIPQSEIAYRYISERIQRKQILPGDLLSENSLANECGMSRTPVREAIRRLAQEGVLVVLPNRGAVVAQLTMKDLDEIYAIREVLEGLSARLASQRITEAGVERLHEFLNEMQAALDSSRHADFSKLDLDFHGEIAKYSRNRRLIVTLETMRTANAAAYFDPGLRQRNPRGYKSLAEHREIVDAIARHDADAAEQRTRHHARVSVRDTLLQAFADDGPTDIDASHE